MSAGAAQLSLFAAAPPEAEDLPGRRVWRSRVRPDVVVDDERWNLPVLRFADAFPVAYEIASEAYSRAFGINSCSHVGWAINRETRDTPGALFERVRTLYDDLRDPIPGAGMFRWRAWYTLTHYGQPGFTGATFYCLTDSKRGYHDLMTLDYTPQTIDQVAQRFALWCPRWPEPLGVVARKDGWKGPDVKRWTMDELRRQIWSKEDQVGGEIRWPGQ